MRRKWCVVSAATLGAVASQASAVTFVNLIAKDGDAPAGGGGNTISTLNTAYVAGNGKVGFLGSLSDSSRFIWFDTGIAFRSSNIVSPVLTGGEGTIGVGDLAQFAYSPSIDGEDGVYSHIGTLARGTDPAPGMPGMFNTFGSRPRMTADGTAYWVGGINNNPGSATTQTRIFWRATTTGGTPTYTPLITGGQSVGADTITATGIEFPYQVSQNNAHTINRVTFSAAPTAAVLLDGALIARAGQAIPGAGNWQNFRFVGVNNSGNNIIYGDDDTTTDDLVAYNGAVLARQGQSLAGVTLGTTVDGAALNNLNQVLHIWDITSTTDEGLFFTDTANVAGSLLLLRSGDQLDTTGDNVADWTLTDFNASATITDPLAFGDNGLAYIDVDLTPIAGGTVVQAIISVAIPEPGSLALAAIGSLAMLRRRKL